MYFSRIAFGVLVMFAGAIVTATMTRAAAPAYEANTLNVRQRGAVGDGVADDTAVFQQALDELGKTGGALYVPRGEYRITKTLRVTGGSEPAAGKRLNWTEIRGEGEGSRLLGDGVDYILGVTVLDKTIEGVDGLYVQGLRVDGIHFTSFDEAEDKRAGGIDASELIRWSCHNSHFSKLKTGIYAASKIDGKEVPVFIIRLHNNHFNNCHDYAIKFDRIFDMVIANNLIEHGRGGIAIGSPGDGYDAAANTLRIVDNVIEGLHAYGKPAILGSCWIGSRIVGNYFEANHAGDIVLTPGENDGWIRGLRIDSNTFQPTVQQMDTGTYGPIKLTKALDTVITGNFTTGPALIDPASQLNGKGINIVSNILNNPRAIGEMAGAQAGSAEDYMGAVAEIVGNERWNVSSPAATVGLDAVRGFMHQPRGEEARTIAYGHEPPTGDAIHYQAGSLIINLTPSVHNDKLVFGWTCIQPGAPGSWKALLIDVE